MNNDFSKWVKDNGGYRIVRERNRQLTQEGWTSEGDDNHVNGELAIGACCYAHFNQGLGEVPGEPPLQAIAHGLLALDMNGPAWPWGREGFKPSADPVRNLEKAGALIAAEIDRLLRKRERETP